MNAKEQGKQLVIDAVCSINYFSYLFITWPKIGCGKTLARRKHCCSIHQSILQVVFPGKKLCSLQASK
jgi:hypothetical protein